MPIVHDPKTGQFTSTAGGAEWRQWGSNKKTALKRMAAAAAKPPAKVFKPTHTKMALSGNSLPNAYPSHGREHD